MAKKCPNCNSKNTGNHEYYGKRTDAYYCFNCGTIFK